MDWQVQGQDNYLSHFSFAKNTSATLPVTVSGFLPTHCMAQGKAFACPKKLGKKTQGTELAIQNIDPAPDGSALKV